jgi:hypothetical protein
VCSGTFCTLFHPLNLTGIAGIAKKNNVMEIFTAVMEQNLRQKTDRGSETIYHLARMTLLDFFGPFAINLTMKEEEDLIPRLHNWVSGGEQYALFARWRSQRQAGHRLLKLLDLGYNVNKIIDHYSQMHH